MPFKINQNKGEDDRAVESCDHGRFFDLVIKNTPILEVTAVLKSAAVGTYPTVAGARYKTRGYATNADEPSDSCPLTNLTQNDVQFSMTDWYCHWLSGQLQEDLGSNEDEVGQKVAEMICEAVCEGSSVLVINGDTAATGTASDKLTLQKTLNGLVKQLDSASMTSPWVAADNTVIEEAEQAGIRLSESLLAVPAAKIYMSPGDYTSLWDDVVNNNKLLAVRDGQIWYRKILNWSRSGHPTGRPIVGDMSNLFVPLKREVYRSGSVIRSSWREGGVELPRRREAVSEREPAHSGSERNDIGQIMDILGAYDQLKACLEAQGSMCPYKTTSSSNREPCQP